VRAEDVAYNVQTIDRTDAPRTVLARSANRVHGHGHIGNNMVCQTSRARKDRENTVRGS